ncbi:MAG TPA: hypothetical protein DCP92_21970 [Nitrospiraceae bacterium]|jgi:hypothetical protein|nr:hypothetical protein [Nitrospiraceae bacterium]
MKRFLLVLGILSAFGLTGSAAAASGQSLSYPAIGIFDNHNEVFKSTVQERSLAGDTQILMQGQDTGLSCTVFYRPTSTALNEYDCEGLEGECFGTCDDGRRFQGAWKATSCSAVVANATDQKGNRVTFVYGYNYAASQFMETPKSAVLMKPNQPLLYADRCSLDR